MDNTTENRIVRARHRVLFTVSSGTKNWLGDTIECVRIDEKDLIPWAEDCVRHHTGRKISQSEWKIFNSNHRLVRMDGQVKYTFEFERFTIQ